jgi:hypothetical protein
MATLVHSGQIRESAVACAAQLRVLRRIAAMLADTLGDLSADARGSAPWIGEASDWCAVTLDGQITEWLSKLAEVK